MNDPRFHFGWLSDARLAAQALGPMPAWLWSADAPRLLWANPIGAAIFEAASPAAVTSIEFEPQHPVTMQIARLSGTLPQAGAPRLERLRGFGAALGGALICLCSRIMLADNSYAILVVATERAGKDLALPERVHRLLADFATPAATFTADGELIDSTPAARERFGTKRDLVALGAAQIAREATLQPIIDALIAHYQAENLKGEAGAALLDSYEAERRPVGKFTVEQAFARYVGRTAPWLQATTKTDPIVHDFNIELGYRYRSNAICAEQGAGNEMSVDPRETFGEPGLRAPHIWLEHNGKRVSTIDLTADWLLLTGVRGEALADEAKKVAKARNLPLTAIAVGTDFIDLDHKFHEAFGVSDTGASLIRPDGFIAWRSHTGGPDAARALQAAFAQILG